jgi:predicted permease
VAISRLNLALLIQMFPNPSSGYSAWIDPDSLVLSPAAFLFGFALSGLTGIIFGLAPALRATRLNLTDEFQGGAHTYGAPALSRTGQFLVLVQIAVACVLLIGASLFGRTIRNLEAIDLGINRQNILMFAIDARSAGIAEKQYGAFPERIAEKLRGVPGVRGVAYSGWPVLTGEGGPFSAKISFPGTNTNAVSLWNQVNPTFFETYGVQVVAGRALEESDVESTRKVVVINESFARQFFPTENALGHSVHFQKQNWEIVGQVRDARLTRASLRGTVDPVMFLPFSQNSQSVARFAVNTASGPEVVLAQIRRAIAEVAPDAIPVGVTTQEEQISWRFFMERLFGRIAAYVGALALTLAAIGLGGLMAHSTAQRTGEIGIRMALGAQPKAILAMVLRQTLSIVGVGLLCGLASAAAVTRLISNRLYGLSALDPVTYAGMALVLLIVAVLAAWRPARRASLINPIDALRNE